MVMVIGTDFNEKKTNVHFIICILISRNRKIIIICTEANEEKDIFQWFASNIAKENKKHRKKMGK